MFPKIGFTDIRSIFAENPASLRKGIMSPHLVGIIGELFNFFGAVALAFDILLRQPERARGRRLTELRDFVVRTGLEGALYKRFTVASPDFVENILDRKAAVCGYIGVGSLAFGFLLLVAYHAMEM
jgi:hypothetical protein